VLANNEVESANSIVAPDFVTYVLSEDDVDVTRADPVELEWKKKKLEDDLTALIERTEEEELDVLISTEAVVALKIAATQKCVHQAILRREEKTTFVFSVCCQMHL
jgi:hypothetical protein